jgi:hypothetical protein
LNKHGLDITTEVVASFNNPKDAKEFALKFSFENKIVESKEWANLIPENGLDGAPEGHEGHTFTEEQLSKISNTSKERWSNPDYKEVMRQKAKNAWTKERKQKQRERLTGKKRPAHSEKMKSRGIPKNFKRSKPMTDDHKKKISEALKGKPKSESHKQNLSKSRISRHSQ